MDQLITFSARLKYSKFDLIHQLLKSILSIWGHKQCIEKQKKKRNFELKVKVEENGKNVLKIRYFKIDMNNKCKSNKNLENDKKIKRFVKIDINNEYKGKIKVNET